MGEGVGVGVDEGVLAGTHPFSKPTVTSLPMTTSGQVPPSRSRKQDREAARMGAVRFREYCPVPSTVMWDVGDGARSHAEALDTGVTPARALPPFQEYRVPAGEVSNQVEVWVLHWAPVGAKEEGRGGCGGRRGGGGGGSSETVAIGTNAKHQPHPETHQRKTGAMHGGGGRWRGSGAAERLTQRPACAGFA